MGYVNFLIVITIASAVFLIWFLAEICVTLTQKLFDFIYGHI